MQYLNDLERIDLDTLTGKEITEFLRGAIYGFANNHNLVRKFSRRGFCWWSDEDFRNIRKKLKEQLKTCKQDNFVNLSEREKLNDLKKEIKEIKKLRVKTVFKERLDRIACARTASEFWSGLRFFRGNKRSMNGAISLEEWVNYYKNIFPAKIPSNITLENGSDNLLDGHFSMAELENALLNAKLKKVPGHDGIPAEFYKFLPDSWKEILLSLFNQVLDTEETPESWSQILVSMLFKKGEIANPENYRPIAQVDVLVKLFTFMLNARLVRWVETKNVLPEFQNGFRKGRGQHFCAECAYSKVFKHGGG